MKNVLLNPTYRNISDAEPAAHSTKHKKLHQLGPKSGLSPSPAEELKCLSILPVITSLKRHDKAVKRSLSKDYQRPNPRFSKKVKGQNLHKSIKSIPPHRFAGDDTLPEHINDAVLRDSADYATAIAKPKKAILKPLESSSDAENYITSKKLSPESRHEKTGSARLGENLEKFSPKTEAGSEKSEPRLILCDEDGYSMHECALDSLLGSLPVADIGPIKDYFEKLIDVSSHEKTADQLNALSVPPSGIDLTTGTEQDEGTPDRKDPIKYTTNYKKALKEADLKYKKQLLGQIVKILPEAYSQKIRALNGTLDVLIDKYSNAIFRPKKKTKGKATMQRQHGAADIGTIPKRQLAVRSLGKKMPPQSAEGESEESKLNVTGTKKVRKAAPESTKDCAEESDFSKVSLRNYVSHKAPTSIKIWHQDYEHLNNHEINQAIALVNKFIVMTFRSKDSTLDVETILKMAKTMKLTLQKKTAIPATFKNREASYGLKEQLSKYISSVVNHSNEYELPESAVLAKGSQYKFCVGKGNNGIMVRSILKQRYWWNYGTRQDENLNLLWTQWCKPKFIAELPSFGKGKAEGPLRVSNHFERHYHLSNKKAMFINLQRYYQLNNQDPFMTLPLTFHIREGAGDPEFAKFTEYYNKLQETSKEQSKVKDAEGKKQKPDRNVWIIKPGEYSNRGCGISVLQDYGEIKRLVGGTGKRPHTYILQKYIEKPLLISKRKFDIRMYGMLTSINGTVKGYFYEEGYIRTSCKEYSLKNLSNKAVHLTNDAVQKKDDDYGKYENGNKLSFADFQRYLDMNHPSLNIDFFRDLLPQIKVIILCLTANIIHRKSLPIHTELFIALSTHIRDCIHSRYSDSTLCSTRTSKCT